MILFCLFVCLFVFAVLGWNPGPCAHWADALPLGHTLSLVIPLNRCPYLGPCYAVACRVPKRMCQKLGSQCSVRDGLWGRYWTPGTLTSSVDWSQFDGTLEAVEASDGGAWLEEAGRWRRAFEGLPCAWSLSLSPTCREVSSSALSPSFYHETVSWNEAFPLTQGKAATVQAGIPTSAVVCCLCICKGNNS
jgi:hypothetical protein